MVFLIDKYKIESVFNTFFHEDIYSKLFFNANNIIDMNRLNTELDKCNTISQFKEFLKFDHANRYSTMHNLFIYGPPGSGKKTLIRLLLEDIYNKSINDTQMISYPITGYSASSEEKLIEQSRYHMIIEPDNNGMDRYVMREVICEYVKQIPLMTNTSFKIVLINNVDNLSQYAQKALRCTIEKYYTTCKFILCGYQASKLITALRSRCHNIRVPKPSYNEIAALMIDVSMRENIMIQTHHLQQIVMLSKRNIKVAFSLLEIYKSNYKPNAIINDNIYTLSWISELQSIVNIIHTFEMRPNTKTFNSNIYEYIRSILYTIFITNVPGLQIIIQFMEMIMKLPFDCKLMAIIMQLFGHYEVRMSKGKKTVIQLEALIHSILYHIEQYKLK